MPRSKTSQVSMKTKDLMEVPPQVVSEDTTIDQAASAMWEGNIGSVIVTDGAGVMVGILTERDVLFAVTKGLTGKGIPVSSVMSKTSLKASPNENIVTAVDRMTRANVRHLPVVSKEGIPLGMISMRDAMSISEPLLKFVLNVARKRRPAAEGSAPEPESDAT